MNHFISGILKIILLEGAIALLLIDAVAGDRFEKVRARAHGVLAGLMVFAWCNYGALRWNTDLATVLTSVPLVLFCGFAIGFAFDPKRDERFAAFKALPEKVLRRRVGLVALAGALVVATFQGWFPGALFVDTAAFVRESWGRLFWLAVIVVGLQQLGRALFSKPLAATAVRHARPIAVGLVIVLSGAWVGAGVTSGRLPLIHQWEQYHFLLGAKYQREVGWFNLYKATILADRESANVLGSLPTTRDLTNFQEVKIDQAMQDAAQVRARFSDARWAEFKADWSAMARLWQINWTQIMNDHGNSNSPAWALLAAPLSRLVPVSANGQAFLGWLDMMLMLGLWLVVWQTFGHRVASIGLFIWAAPPLVFDYLSGSFLRWDWLFALGLAACFLKQKRYGWAGGFFGFAVATKLFPLFFGVALGIRALFEWRATKQLKPDYVRFGLATVAAGATAVVLSAGLFGVDAWKEYAQRIEVAQVEKFYAIQYSFKSVVLQHVAGSSREWGQTIFPGDLKQRSAAVEVCGGASSSSTGTTCHQELTRCGDGASFTMDCAGNECTCSNGQRFTEADACDHRATIFRTRCGFPENYALELLVAKVLFSLVIVVLLRRATDVEAFVLGPLLVFTWLVVNMYYWNMLGLLAMGLALRAERPNQRPALGMLIGLHVIFMVFYLYQHLNRGLTEGYAVAWLITVLTIATAAWELRVTRRSEMVDSTT